VSTRDGAGVEGSKTAGVDVHGRTGELSSRLSPSLRENAGGVMSEPAMLWPQCFLQRGRARVCVGRVLAALQSLFVLVLDLARVPNAVLSLRLKLMWHAADGLTATAERETAEKALGSAAWWKWSQMLRLPPLGRLRLVCVYRVQAAYAVRVRPRWHLHPA